MTNGEKAQKIIEVSNANMVYDIVDFKSLHEEQMEDLLEMAEWKDEQHAEEKRQWIEKACEWLKENIYDYYTTGDGGDEFEGWFDDMFEDFKKAMEE